MKKFFIYCSLFQFTYSLATEVVRFGFFPNLTHLHALIAQNFAKDGTGWFEKYLPGIKIEWHRYNAGPAAMEAFIAGTLDVTYVGPSPASNVFVRSDGNIISILAGAVYGGSALVVRNDVVIEKNENLRGKIIATPQLGNTQDIALRKWLSDINLQVGYGKNDVKVMPMANPEQFILFVNKSIDAAWTVEPWCSRLVNDAGGKIYFRDNSSLTTILTARTKFVNENVEIINKIIKAHEDLTNWIKNNQNEACQRIQNEFIAQTKTNMPIEVIKNCINNIVLNTTVTKETMSEWINAAKSLNFIPKNKEIPSINNLFFQK